MFILDQLIRFAFEKFPESRGIRMLQHEDVERVRSTLVLSPSAFFDYFSRRVAHSYEANHLSFEIADCAMNSLNNYCLSQYHVALPSYANEVFQAFDQGEFHHREDDASINPEIKYTRPQVSALVVRDRILGSQEQAPQLIKPVREIFVNRSILLPELPGVYAFWWIGDREKLLSSNRNIVLKGPKEQPVDVEYKDWWPAELSYPCLYVGKTTNMKKRFALHIKRDSLGRLHLPHPENWKATPNTTSCQLRWGIEHIFPNELNPLQVIFNSVGFSYRTDFSENAIAERFFEEDRLVGTWRPWFNIDSER